MRVFADNRSSTFAHAAKLTQATSTVKKTLASAAGTWDDVEKVCHQFHNGIRHVAQLFTE